MEFSLNPEDLPAQLKAMHEHLAEHEDQAKMQQDADEADLRRFLEELNGEQIRVLRKLIGSCMSNKTHARIMYGAVMREDWLKNPITPEKAQ